MSAYDEVHVKALGRAMDATAQDTHGRGAPQLSADYEGIMYIIVDDDGEPVSGHDTSCDACALRATRCPRGQSSASRGYATVRWFPTA